MEELLDKKRELCKQISELEKELKILIGPASYWMASYFPTGDTKLESLAKQVDLLTGVIAKRLAIGSKVDAAIAR